MSEEFIAMFRDTQRHTPSPPHMRSTASEPPLPHIEPSTFLRRFLNSANRSPGLVPSGLSDLDERLAGGFGSGLHLVLGLPGAGKTAFLESVAWEAFSSERPVLYYALKEGGLGVWERLISTLGQILGGPTISHDALRTRALAPHDLETLTRLDLALQDRVLPYLSLVQDIPAYAEALSVIIDDVRLRTREIKERHGKIPLLLIDDLERLLIITRARPLPLLLSRMNDVLAENSVPGLLTATTPDPCSYNLDVLQVETVLALGSVSTSAVKTLERVDLELRYNARTGWTGTLSLLRDRSSGLFAHPSVSTDPGPG